MGPRLRLPVAFAFSTFAILPRHGGWRSACSPYRSYSALAGADGRGCLSVITPPIALLFFEFSFAHRGAAAFSGAMLDRITCSLPASAAPWHAEEPNSRPCRAVSGDYVLLCVSLPILLLVPLGRSCFEGIPVAQLHYTTERDLDPSRIEGFLRAVPLGRGPGSPIAGIAVFGVIQGVTIS